MTGLKIQVDEGFINGLISKILFDDIKNDKGITDINVRFREENILVSASVDVLGRKVMYESIMSLNEIPLNLGSGRFVLDIDGDKGLRKIIEGFAEMVSKLTDMINSDDYRVVIDLEKVPENFIYQDLMEDLNIDELSFKDGAFRFKMNFK